MYRGGGYNIYNKQRKRAASGTRSYNFYIVGVGGGHVPRVPPPGSAADQLHLKYAKYLSCIYYEVCIWIEIIISK